MSAVTQSSRWQHPFVLPESSTPLTIRSSNRYLHWCLSRLISTSVLSSWHLSFSCRPLSEFDSDWLLRVLRSVQLFSLIELLSRDLRSVRLTSVQSEMAEANDMNSLGQFSSNRITIAQRVLKGSSEGTIAAKAPPPFRDTRGANHRLLSSEDIANQWIRFGMPPAVVYSAYFVNTSTPAKQLRKPWKSPTSCCRGHRTLRRNVPDGSSYQRDQDL